MKKLFLSLAALVMTMSAPMMTSCSSEDLDEVAPAEEVKENVVTLTIAPPVAEPVTRVKMGGEKGLTITGWEENDVVKVYYVEYNESDYKIEVSEAIEFTCTDPDKGTFTGTLPEGKTLSNYNLAVYGQDIEDIDDGYSGFVGNMISDKLKDVIFMAGEISGGSCTMKICNNVIKVNNIGSPVTVAWREVIDRDFFRPFCWVNEASVFLPIPSYPYSCSFEEAQPFTIPFGVRYISMPVIDPEYLVGLYTEELMPIIPAKGKDGSAGKLYTITIGGTPSSTTGTAKARINSSDVDVNWVQLWAGGPRFAEYNVGVTDGKAESYGGYYCWGSSIDKDSNAAYKSGTDDLSGADDTATKLWGSAWRMPTKEELASLPANCDVEWTTVNGVNVCKFTGRGDYASNSVSLPAAGNYVDVDVLYQGDFGGYWSSTPDRSSYAYYLYFDSGNQKINYGYRGYGISVRAVLK